MGSPRALRDLYTAPRAMRSPSLSSDVQSSLSAAGPALPEANPPPAFVASAEASQLVSSEVDETVNVKEQALVLLNSFLDQILYNILSTAQSTQLGRLRDAIAVVLKLRLGRAALTAADEELKEYLNDGDDEVLNGADARFESRSDFNLELAWRLARLRCMVYTRLGDMEEEDEEEYIEADQLHPGRGTYSNAAHRVSSIKAASAIFLTSILEYVGEQALLYAVQNTQRRARVSRSPVALQLHENGPTSPPIHQAMVLEEVDMFSLGRESPLSRLWRSWRRQARPPLETVSTQLLPMQEAALNNDSPTAERTQRINENAGQKETQGFSLPYQVPLPMSHNDVNEIEVPGLAREIVDDEDAPSVIPVPERSKRRPVSLVINKSDAIYQRSPESPQNTMTMKHKRRSRPDLGHKRSTSYPAPEKSTFAPVASLVDQDNVEMRDVQEANDEGLDRQKEQHISHKASDDLNEETGEAKEEQKSSGVLAAAVSTAVGAVGAVGLGALASAGGSKSSPSETMADSQTSHVRTVADEMIGTTPHVPPPKDAFTGSSITSVGDFNNLHIPIEKQKPEDRPENGSRMDSSDPEDLALSSGDEAASESKISVANTSAPEIAASAEPGHSSKDIDPQGMHFATSPDATKTNIPLISHHEPDRLLYPPVSRVVINGTGSNHHIVTIPVTTSPSSTRTAIDRSALSSSHVQPENDMAREFVTSPPKTATTTIHSSVPPRLSSDRSRSGHAHADSRTSEYSQHSDRSSSSSKLLGFTRDDQGRPQSSTIDSPVTDGAASNIAGNAQAGLGSYSGSSRSTKRPLQIQTNTAIARDLDEAEAKKRSLEILIRGDETLHYTLTPLSARAENFSVAGLSPNRETNFVDSSLKHSSTDEASVAHRSTASTNSSTINGLRANPVSDMKTSAITKDRNGAYESPTGGIAPSTFAAARTRSNRAQPRDARLENTTMLDLADYARSTGPENDHQLPKALSSRPGTSGTVKTMQSASNTVRSTPAPPVPTARSPTLPKQSAKSVGARTRFQPREPTVARKSATNDLIEFLREGPPASPGGANGHSLNENGRASAASTHNSSVAPRSVQESMNSATALLSSNRTQSKANGLNAAASTVSRQGPAPQGNGMPARKQRRVHDPYAIDYSDDDLEELHAAAQTRNTQDESLIDFLRNTQPPPGSSTPPLVAGSSAAAAARPMRRQSSNQGIRERIMRSASRSSLSRKPSVSSRPTTVNDEPPQYYRSSTNARATSPHLVQTGRKIDSYKPTTVTHAPHVERNRTQKVARPPTGTGRTDTADLADYFKNSGPPEIASNPVRQSSLVREEAGFLKFFSRRKAMK